MKRITIGIAMLLFSPMIISVRSSTGVTIIIPDQYPSIQQGIDAALNGDTVLVRDGTYKLSAALDFKGKAIVLRSENGANSCILDGQGQTRLVYFHTGEGSGSVLSGFTIQSGRADLGAGIYVSSSSPTITDCKIITNNAISDAVWPVLQGGGLYMNDSSANISNCIISGNYAGHGLGPATGDGGGIYINGGAPIIRNCIVNGNTATAYNGTNGGGIFVAGSSPSISNTTISNNSTYGTYLVARGGGIFFSRSTPSMVNCVIYGNNAQDGGGIYFDQSSMFSKLTNNTIVRNIATQSGGGLFFANSSPSVINSILWEDSPQEVYNESSIPTITYSDVLGGYSGAGNTNASPLFVNLPQQDFHLRSGSPCLDVGSNAAPELPLQDKDGNARINNFVVDMGAYEFASGILLLNNNRFRVQVDWHIPSGATGQGTAVPLTSDSGYFWFFSGSNVELLVKILDGRGVNNHYWFFWGAMTDVQYTLTVTDTETGAIKTYQGVQGVQKSGNDITAF